MDDPPCADTAKTVTAREAADLLITLTLPTFARLPATLISDRDPRFTAEVWRETWARLGTKLAMTTAHRPQADGQSERANRQVVEYLRHFVNAAGSDWDDAANVAMMEFALNSHRSSATESSSYLLHLGRPPVPPAATTNLQTGAREVAIDTRWRWAKEAMDAAQERMMC